MKHVWGLIGQKKPGHLFLAEPKRRIEDSERNSHDGDDTNRMSFAQFRQ